MFINFNKKTIAMSITRDDNRPFLSVWDSSTLTWCMDGDSPGCNGDLPRGRREWDVNRGSDFGCKSSWRQLAAFTTGQWVWVPSEWVEWEETCYSLRGWAPRWSGHAHCAAVSFGSQRVYSFKDKVFQSLHSYCIVKPTLPSRMFTVVRKLHVSNSKDLLAFT